MEDVYILDGLRTPIGVKNGQFKAIRPENLAVPLIKALCKKYAIDTVDGVVCGNGTGGNICRLTALMSGLPSSVPAMTIDMQCASGAAAIDYGATKLAAGMGDIFLVGGMESASLQPLRTYAAADDRFSFMPQGQYKVAQFSPDTLSQTTMLEGAEQVIQKEQITADELDTAVVSSHSRAAAARKTRILIPFIFPIKGIDTDESIRPSMSRRLLRRLPPLLGPGTMTTAGNACLTHDGAAFALLCSKRFALQNNMNPIGRIVATAAIGCDPRMSPYGASIAAAAVLKRAGLHHDDMDAIEYNEAFAAIDVLFARQYPHLLDRYNRFGGALAYGHPYGASGTILLLHLLASLTSVSGRLGLLAIAGAGGTGEAIIVEAL